ncbi:hypothetical protein PanWU01x14_186350 [Parasponia andersonii]|uniref:Transmembrane protein n=1 Tax=Parasponia andersonii TaxID=3476 RepID=A0A2P5C3P1_PARAD|nr:hypothetical protein PanWU01x14_186350 [Parasponia andersonii]
MSHKTPQRLIRQNLHLSTPWHYHSKLVQLISTTQLIILIILVVLTLPFYDPQEWTAKIQQPYASQMSRKLLLLLASSSAIRCRTQHCLMIECDQKESAVRFQSNAKLLSLLTALNASGSNASNVSTISTIFPQSFREPKGKHLKHAVTREDHEERREITLISPGNDTDKEGFLTLLIMSRIMPLYL